MKKFVLLLVALCLIVGMSGAAWAAVRFDVLIQDGGGGIADLAVQIEWHDATNPPAGGTWSGWINAVNDGGGWYHITIQNSASTVDQWRIQITTANIAPINPALNPTAPMFTGGSSNPILDPWTVQDNRLP